MGEQPAPDGRRSSSVLAEVSLLLAVLFVGNAFVAVKFALEGIPPLVLVPLRYVLAGLLVLGLARLIEPESRLKRKDFLVVAGLGCVGVALNQAGYTTGLSLTSGSNASLVFATAPV